MPEIPEIEGLVAFLSDRIVGLRFADVQVAAISAIKTADPPITGLGGARVTSVSRAGKFLLIATADGVLAIHLSRAGWLRWLDEPSGRAVRMGRGPLAARFTFVDDHGVVAGGFDLTEAGTQKRLAMYLVRDPDDVPGIARLGPDPLTAGFDRTRFDAVLADGGARHVKTLLRDQSALAGVGNAYSDEILHTARISPAAPASSLTPEQRDALYAALESVLVAAVADARGRPPDQLKDGKRAVLRVHGRTGKPCPVCGDTIREVSSADSSFQYCPTCQNGGKLLADRRLSRLLK